MKRIVILLSVICLVVTAEKSVTPTYVARSQSCNRLFQLVGSIGWGHTDIGDMDNAYGSASAVIGRSQSFFNNNIAACLFGDDITCATVCKNQIKVQGSDVANRNNYAWLADYFYLSSDYDGAFNFEPAISNIFADFGLYVGFDAWVKGMYARVFVPVVHTSWQTHFCVAAPDNAFTTSAAIGYMTPSGTETLLSSLADYFRGYAPESVDDVFFTPLQVAKMPACATSKTGLAEIRFELGWNFINEDVSHLGFYMQAAAPTGGQRKAEYVFDPLIGNGNHWEFGGGLAGHLLLAESYDQEIQTSWYFDFLVTHLFGATEQRTFDLSAKSNSRYMLALSMQPDVQDGLAGSNLPDTSAANLAEVTPPDAQFSRVFNPVANLTTSFVSISSTAQIDFVTFLDVEVGNFSIDVGYNLWMRSCEKISRSSGKHCGSNVRITLFDEGQDDRWALKGDAHVFGYTSVNGCDLAINTPVALSATESSATIHQGTNLAFEGQNSLVRNLGVDTARFAYAGGDSQRLLYAPGIANSEADHIKTSINPQFINFENISFKPTRGLSQTIFAHVSYTFEREGLIPYVGIGASAEFGSNKESNIVPIIGETTLVSQFNTCITCSLSQWTAWIKGGISF